MMVLFCSIVLSLLAVPSLAGLNVGFSSYDNDFVEPSYVLGKNWNKTTIVAQESIVRWADYLAAQGPWSVTASKPFLAPSNDTHDYLSWAPYYFPNCSGVGNTTVLTPQQIWVTCPYYQLDGQFNPDVRTVNNTGAFSAMADAVLYNALAWAINGSSVYSSNVANWINTWFLANATYMNPNLNYAQVVRGPQTYTTGTHTGVLDLKCMVKVLNAVLVMREGNASEWTSLIDSGLITWTKSYIGWLTTNTLALQEAAAANNHGSYYYNQLTALQILMDDTTSANATVQKYFSTLFQNQINGTGEQPLEAVRTRPYHYRAYNLAAMITNARLGAHVGFDAWNLKSASGGTIQAALDFAMTIPAGSENPTELYPDMAAIAAEFGDRNPSTGATYSSFLASAQQNYPAYPWFFWDQPLTDLGWVSANAGGPGAATPSGSGSGTSGAPASPASGARKNGGARVLLDSFGRMFLGGTAILVVLLHILLFA